jgi:hypothetical protein
MAKLPDRFAAQHWRDRAQEARDAPHAFSPYSRQIPITLDGAVSRG